jgi:hypothetical protein
MTGCVLIHVGMISHDKRQSPMVKPYALPWVIARLSAKTVWHESARQAGMAYRTRTQGKSVNLKQSIKPHCPREAKRHGTTMRSNRREGKREYAFVHRMVMNNGGVRFSWFVFFPF